MADEEFPLTRRFTREMWAALGGDVREADDVEVQGVGALASCYAMSDLGAASFATTGLAMRELVSTAFGDRPSVRVDRRLAYGWLRGGAVAVGERPPRPTPFHTISTDYESADGRFVRLQANYEHIRSATLATLGVSDDPDAIAEVVRRHGADEVEQRILDGGGAAAASRTMAEWDAHPQGAAVAAEPLVDVTPGELGESSWRPTQGRPLVGLRVLDLTRVLAGPLATRALAGLGAEVLRLDAPGYDEPIGSGGDIMLGKRCARLDLRTVEGARRLRELLAQADVLVHGLRPGALERLGLDRATRAEIRPGLVEVTLNAYGWSGPWVDRRSFDTLVQSSCGMADAGMHWSGQSRPYRWPLSILDHATGYLMAAATIRGVTRRLETGRGSSARLALARTGALLMAAGEPPEEAELPYPLDGPYDPTVFTTVNGPVRRLVWPVDVEGVPVHFERPGDPYGSSTPSWIGELTSARW